MLSSAAVQTVFDEQFANTATKHSPWCFGVLDPQVLCGLVMSAVGAQSERISWWCLTHDLCSQLKKMGRRYMKLLLKPKPFKRPTARQLAQADAAVAPAQDSNTYTHLQSLSEMLTPYDLCKLRSVNQHWRRVVNSFSVWPAALTIPPVYESPSEGAWRFRPSADSMLEMVAAIPHGSLSAVTTLTFGKHLSSEWYMNKKETRSLLWTLRQCAPNIELPILLAFPNLHSLSVHESPCQWPKSYQTYKEHEGRADPKLSFNPFSAANPEDHNALTVNQNSAVNQQWQQLKEKCTVWFKNTSGGGPKASKAAAEFTQYVDPDGDE